MGLKTIINKIIEDINTYGVTENSKLENLINKIKTPEEVKYIINNSTLKDLRYLPIIDLIEKLKNNSKLDKRLSNKVNQLNMLLIYIEEKGKLPSAETKEYKVYANRMNNSVSKVGVKEIERIWETFYKSSKEEYEKDRIGTLRKYIEEQGKLPNRGTTEYNIYIGRMKGHISEEGIIEIEKIWDSLKLSKEEYEKNKIETLRKYIEEKGKYPNVGTSEYNIYASRMKGHVSEEGIIEIEKIWDSLKSSSKEEYEKDRIETLRKYIEEKGKLPIRGITEYNIYSNRLKSIISKEGIIEIEKIWDSIKSSSKKEHEKNKIENLRKYIEEKGKLPNRGTMEHTTYSNRLKGTISKEGIIEIEKIWDSTKSYSKKEQEKIKIKILRKYIEEKGKYPNVGTSEYNIYASRMNGSISKEGIIEIERIWEKNKKNRNIMEDINKIINHIEDLINSIQKNKETRDLIPMFSLIEHIYNDFSEEDREKLFKYNSNIKELCDHIEKRNYSSLTTELLLNISTVLINTVKDNETKNGQYLAWKLNKDLYQDEEEKDSTVNMVNEEEDLYKLSEISEFLKFENSAESKNEIIGGFQIFLNNIIVLKDGDKVELLNSTPSIFAEVKSHIITFFENFNKEDFEKLKKELIGKSEADFLDVIITKINNSSLVIPNKIPENGKYKQPTSVFQKTKTGKWYYAMKTSGKLDLHASYDKEVITASITTSSENGYEGSQLLLHPIKEKLISYKVMDILLRETELNTNRRENGYAIFSKESILFGLKWKKNLETNKVSLEVNSEEDLKSNELFKDMIDKDEMLIERQLENMNVNIILPKIILEGRDYRKKSDNVDKKARLSTYRTDIVQISANNNKQTLSEYFEKNNIKSGKLSKENLEEILGNHIFDFQSLTLKTLNVEENELLIEYWLHKEFYFYEGFVEDNVNVKEVFFNQLKVRNPLIKIDLEIIYENNKSREYTAKLVELFLSKPLPNIYNKASNQEEILIDLYNEKFPDEENTLTDEFTRRLTYKKNHEMFLHSIVEFIHDLSLSNPDEAKGIINNEVFITNLDSVFYSLQGKKNIKERLQGSALIQSLEKFIEEKQNINSMLFDLLSKKRISQDELIAMSQELNLLKSEDLSLFKAKYKSLLYKEPEVIEGKKP